jgi:hypothetical protein
MTLRDVIPGDAARPLYHDWRVTLARAMTRVLGRPIDGDDAPRRLERVSAAALRAIDPVIRAECAAMFRPRATPAMRMPPSRPLRDIEAFLFLHACDANGYVREQALEMFRGYHGSLAMATALLRCADWVEPVRNAAVDLLSDLLAHGYGDRLFSQLDLVLPLRGRRRMAERAWPELLEPVLRDPRYTAMRLNAAHSRVAEVRLFALELAGEVDPGSLSTALANAAQDDDMRVALWAVRAAPSTNVARRTLDLALKHPQPAVRAEALRRWTALDLPDLRATLERFVFDAAREPRNVARFLLRERYGADAAALWRAALDASDATRQAIALDAMRDHATDDDMERLRPWLRHPRASSRMAALDALARISASDLSEHLASALRDSRRRVVRNAIHCCRIARHALSFETLRDAYADAATVDTRHALTEAVSLAGKWEALELLLDWFAQSGPVLAPTLQKSLDRWSHGATQRYAKLDENRKARLIAALERARERHPAFAIADIVSALRFA